MAELAVPRAPVDAREFCPDVGDPGRDYWPQADFIFDQAHFYKGYFGGVGIGKTLTLVLDTFRYALEYPGSRQILTEPSYQMIRDIMIPTIQENFGEQEGRAYRMTKSPPFNITFATAPSVSAPGRPTRRYPGSEAWLRSTETGQRMYGPNVHRVRMDEITIGHQQEQAQILAQRCRNPFGGYPLGLEMTGTPKGRNWVWQFFIESPRADRPAYLAETAMNPHLPADYIPRMLEFYGGWDNPLARQELGGQWLQLTGPVFPQFARLVHCAVLPKGWTHERLSNRIGGIDFGGVSPTALIGGGLDAADRAWAFAEWYRHQATIDMLIEAMADWRQRYGIRRWVADPAGKEQILMLEHAGFDVTPATHGNDLKLRVQLVGRRLNLGPGNLPGCYFVDVPNLITELETLAWKRIKLPGRGMEIMNDEFERGAPDHAFDAWANVLSEFDDPEAEVPDWQWEAA